MDLDPKVVQSWVQENLENDVYAFVGVSSDNEVFIRAPYNTEATTLEKELEIRDHIKERFPEVSSIVFVVEPSIQEIQDMVKGLNKLLEVKKEPLLDIGKF